MDTIDAALEGYDLVFVDTSACVINTIAPDCPTSEIWHHLGLQDALNVEYLHYLGDHAEKLFTTRGVYQEMIKHSASPGVYERSLRTFANNLKIEELTPAVPIALPTALSKADGDLVRASFHYASHKGPTLVLSGDKAIQHSVRLLSSHAAFKFDTTVFR